MTEYKELNKQNGRIVSTRLVEKVKQELMGKTAFEKQNPNKVVNMRNLAVAKIGSCPTCGESVRSTWNMFYCGDCGQKLDWGDE